MATEQEKELKPVNRGWILFWSTLIEIGVLIGLSLPFLLPSVISLIKPTRLPMAGPPTKEIVVRAILLIAMVIIAQIAIKNKRLKWSISLLLLLLFVIAGGLGPLFLPTISLTTPSIKGLISGGIVGIVGAVAVGFFLIYSWWAPNNLYFTFVKEGTAKIVVKAHKFDKVIAVFKDHFLDNKGNIKEISGDRNNASVKLYKKIPLLKHLDLGGLKYYGFWPIWDIFTYEFGWTGVKENGEFEPHPKEVLDYIILKDDVYGLLVGKAEDKELMPLDVQLTLTIKITNPYKALFVPENWYETTMNRIRPYVRDYITTDTFTNFIKDPKRIDKDVWERLQSEGILGEREGILGELVDRYGVDVRKIEVNAINPIEAFREATMAKVLALREKDAIVTKARAERERLKTVAQGEKKRIDTVYGAVQGFGDLGEKVRTLEALEKSPEGGAKWVVPLPGMADILSRVFSKKRPFHPKSRRNQNRQNTSNQQRS